MSTLLVVTVGQTDVQLVTEGHRREFWGGKCGALHRVLEQRRGEWQIVDTPSRKHDQKVETIPPGPFDLCTPKLDAVMEYLRAEGKTVIHALVLETRRDPTAETRDPYMAGEVVKCRLYTHWGLVESQVCRAPYLVDSERFEGKSDRRDEVVRREVVARIDKAIATSISEFMPQRIVVAATGGLPVVCNLVEEIAQLHASSKREVMLLEVPDASLGDSPGEDRAVPRVIEPAASYRARWHALHLIENGNFIAAWGAVRHLHDDEVERRWTRVVEWLYCFATSLPLPDDCDIDCLRHRHMAVRAALRAELALRAGDIPRGVHGTVAFFEAALWDHLDRHVKRHPAKRRLFKIEPLPEDMLVRTSKDTDDDRRRPFEVAEEIDGVHWYRIYDDDVCGVRLAKHYLRSNDLEKLGQAASKIRELRNDVAHNEPTPKLMDEARRRMAEAGLWSHGDDPRFLTQELVQNVLKELGEKEPQCLADELIETVRQRLVRFPPEIPT